MDEIIRNSGLPDFIFEDWTAATVNLLGNLGAAVAVNDGAGASVILYDAFNNDETSNSIVQHFRVSIRWIGDFI